MLEHDCIGLEQFGRGFEQIGIGLRFMLTFAIRSLDFDIVLVILVKLWGRRAAAM